MDAYACRRSWRAVFISDLHLGARACQAELVLDFLQSMSCRTLYLVGDVVDGWRLSADWRWPPAHDAVARRLLAMAEGGVQVIYVPGNHDAFARGFLGRHLHGVEVTGEAVHAAADGRRYLVTHGDLYDGAAARPGWRAWAGDLGYRALTRANLACDGARRRLGRPYWSLAAALKRRSATAGRYTARFERALAAEAARRGLDGVICGHIHRAAAREIDGVLYVNDGDWVENCTAAVEDFDGRIELIDWASLRGGSRQARAPAPQLGPSLLPTAA